MEQFLAVPGKLKAAGARSQGWLPVQIRLIIIMKIIAVRLAAAAGEIPVGVSQRMADFQQEQPQQPEEWAQR